jgi:tetratricopeptide (TPR) repeat protein
MYRSSLFLAAALVGTSIAFVQPAAAAKSAAEVEAIARSAAVEIKLNRDPSAVSSGVIIHRKGDLYTLVTSRHVVCGSRRCSELPVGESYSLGLSDGSIGSSTGQQYQVQAASVKLLGNNLDLAIIQFRSDRNYGVVKVAVPGSLKIDDDVYTSGFPSEKPGFILARGKALAVVNKRLLGDSGGYTVVYDALTLPGMAGGGVFNDNGQLVAIHGWGDRYRENTILGDNSRIGSKIGTNRGVPVHWLVRNLTDLGIDLGVNLAGTSAAATADMHFIAGLNKSIDPGVDVMAGKRQAIEEFSKAIRLNPKYQYAYFQRALVYEQLREFQRSLADYDRAIFVNPKYSKAYNNRALLKADRLNDIPGAIQDFRQAARLFRAQGNTGDLQLAIAALRKLGASE